MYKLFSISTVYTQDCTCKIGLTDKLTFYINFVLGLNVVGDVIYIRQQQLLYIDKYEEILNLKIQSLLDSKLNEFIEVINEKNFIHLSLSTTYGSKCTNVMNLLLNIKNKKMLEHVCLYSGACLYLIGATITEDIDLLFTNISHEDIKSNFKHVIRSVDYCYRSSNVYLNKHNKVHHNNDTLRLMFEKYNESSYMKYNGINIFNLQMIKYFYQLRLTSHFKKGHLLYDIMKLRNMNNVFIAHNDDVPNLRYIIFESDILKLKDLLETYDYQMYSIESLTQLVKVFLSKTLHQGSPNCVKII